MYNYVKSKSISSNVIFMVINFSSNILAVMLNVRTHVLLHRGVNGVHVNHDIATKITAYKKEDHQEELDIKSHQFQVNKNMSRSLRHWIKKCLIECAIYFKGEESHLRIEWKGDFDIQQLVLYLNEFDPKLFVMTNCRRTNISWLYRV